MVIRRRGDFSIKNMGCCYATIITNLMSMPKVEVKVEKEGGEYNEKEGGKKRPVACITLE